MLFTDYNYEEEDEHQQEMAYFGLDNNSPQHSDSDYDENNEDNENDEDDEDDEDQDNQDY